jgi:hypothetical protein
MNGDGYAHLYRGINELVWLDHFSNKDNLCPMENGEHLKNATIFIAHGKNDKNINFKHSKRYCELLHKTFPDRKEQFLLSLYDGDHSASTSNKAVVDYLTWRKIPKTA